MTARAWQQTSWNWHENVAPFLPLYGLAPDSAWSLLSFSENAVYRINTPQGETFILRLHRPHYRSVDDIRSEITFIEHLRTDKVLLTPAILPTLNRETLSFTGQGEQEQHAVLFAYHPGHAPSEDRLAEEFHELGRISARLHNYTATHTNLNRLRRPVWNVDVAIGPNAMWGCWRNTSNMTAEQTALLDAADRMVRTKLERYGRPIARWGLLHGDMRLTNILRNGDETCIIDFDDCGFGWHMYEFACACTFMECCDNIEALTTSWLRGYAQIRPLSQEDIQIVPTLLMLRRLLMVGWFTTHQHSAEARALEPGFLKKSLTMAKDYLDGTFLSCLTRTTENA
ncbi:putative homoserine kinase type II [Acetobacter estunensis NRIC 0472]|uniref:Phosphotransferase n=1 Tax=Acetobacter estunensis TaxID=104097 RepID=A0A967B9K3_9PROT|nr:phosphotransferase [Acetobacter estunensis]NHO55408.1 phosphotransferase [Acetobacter estunensis]GBQ25727.1 putative homoserine kinase type II [Acetobacter estunensis NRIC 0472]